MTPEGKIKKVTVVLGANNLQTFLESYERGVVRLSMDRRILRLPGAEELQVFLTIDPPCRGQRTCEWDVLVKIPWQPSANCVKTSVETDGEKRRRNWETFY